MESKLIWNDPVNGYDAYFTEDSYKKLVQEETFDSKLSKSIVNIQLQRQSNHIVHGENKGNKSATIGENNDSNSAVIQEDIIQKERKKSTQDSSNSIEFKPAIKMEVKTEPVSGQYEDFVLPTTVLSRKIGGLQKKSSISKIEQRRYIDLLLKYRFHPPGPNLSNTEKKDLKYFESLQTRVAAEQNEVICKLRELAPNQGIYNFLSHDGRRYLQEKHEEKLKQVEDLPRYFVTINNPFPLNVTVNPGSPPPSLVFVKTLAELGVPARISIPTICNNEKKMIPNDYEKVFSQCPTSIQSESENKYCKQVCSKDKNCEMLACKTYSHIVLCTSVLRCLINNHAPDFNTAWEIPVTVKTHQLQYQGQIIKQKVVYFDKPLPPKEQSNRDKNTKYHKYALRAFLARSQHKTCVKNKLNIAVSEKKNKQQTQKSMVKDEDPFGDVSINDIETFGNTKYTSVSSLTSKSKENSKLQSESRVKSESSSMVELNKDLFGSGSETEAPCDKNQSDVLEACSGNTSDGKNPNESFSELSDSDITDKECEENIVLSLANVKDDTNSASSMIQDVEKSCSQTEMQSSESSKDEIESQNYESITESSPTVSKDSENILTSADHRSETDMAKSSNDLDIEESDSKKVLEPVRGTRSNKNSLHVHNVSKSDLKTSSTPNEQSQKPDSEKNVPNILESCTDSESEENLVIDLGNCDSQVKKRKIEQIWSPGGKREEHFLCNPKPTKIVDLSKKDKNVPNRVPFAIFKQKWKLRPLTSDDLDPISPVKDKNVVRLRSGKTVGNLSGDESSSSFSQSDSESVFTPPKKPRQMEDITSPDNLSQSDCDDEIPVKLIPLEKQEYGQLMMIPKQPKNKTTEQTPTEDSDTPSSRVLRSHSRCSESHDQSEPIEIENLADEKLTAASRERRKSPRIHRSSSDIETKDTEVKSVEISGSTAIEEPVVKRKRGRPKKEPLKPLVSSKESQLDKEPVDTTRPSVRRSLSLEKPNNESNSNTTEDNKISNTGNNSDVSKEDKKDGSSTINTKNKHTNIGTPSITRKKNSKASESNLLDDILGKTDKEAEKKKDGQGEYLEPVDGQISYHLWKFSGLSMIIRTSSHGMVRDARQSFQGHIVPKLEYQIKHGIEQITLEEVSQAWISCYIKPFSQLIRGRISASSSELLMIETLDLNQILSQATHFNIIGALCSLHNILMTVYSLENGTYLLCHEAGEPHFQIKQSTQNKRGAYDLQFSHQGHSNVNEKKNQWFPIDTNIILPHHKVQGRIPATYEPEDFNTGNISNKRKGGKKKKWNNKR